MTGKGALGGGIVALTLVLSVTYLVHSTKAKAKAEKRGMFNPAVCRNEDGDWVPVVTGKNYKDRTGDCLVGTPPPPPPPPRTVEALVLEHECLTPCSAFVGWSYKVRTDGDPLRIKYQDADWFDQPARESFQAPKGFKPGEAQFVSPDEARPHVRVWVYKKIIVRQ